MINNFPKSRKFESSKIQSKSKANLVLLATFWPQNINMNINFTICHNEKSEFLLSTSNILKIESGHDLGSKGSVRFHCKRVHLDLYFRKYPSKLLFLSERNYFSLILRWAASNNQKLIWSKIGPGDMRILTTYLF